MPKKKKKGGGKGILLILIQSILYIIDIIYTSNSQIKHQRTNNSVPIFTSQE